MFSNIVAFSKKEVDVEKSYSWDYKGEAEYVDKLVEYARSANSTSQISRATLSLMKEDKHITMLMETAEEDGGDVNVLLTLRRKVRQSIYTLVHRMK